MTITRRRDSVRITTIAAVLLLRATLASAQPAVGVTLERDRATYHFDNPSSIDTPELVPHYFEQTYDLDHLWLTASMRYRWRSVWVTSVGIGFPRTTTATDYDTFLKPDGSIWVAGTTGGARTGSWRVEQRVDLGRVGPVDLTGGYALRVDAADFLDGDRTVTRDGVLLSRDRVSAPEHANAQRHDVFVGASLAGTIGNTTHVRVQASVAPASIARLAIELPDKYPGQTLVYRTNHLWATASVELSRRVGPVPLTLRLDAGTSVRSHATQWVSRRTLAITLTAGR